MVLRRSGREEAVAGWLVVRSELAPSAYEWEGPERGPDEVMESVHSGAQSARSVSGSVVVQARPNASTQRVLSALDPNTL